VLKAAAPDAALSKPGFEPLVDAKRSERLREEAKNWKCQNLASTEHGGDAAALLRKAADAIEQLGDIEILDVTYRRPTDLRALELTVTCISTFAPNVESWPE